MKLAGTLETRPATRITRSGLLAMALVPKLGCPLCWPVLATLCGLLGVSFTMLNPILLAANVLGLLLALRFILRHGYGALAVLTTAVLSASLAYRLGAGWAPCLCIGPLVALLLWFFVRTHIPCCNPNQSSS